MCALAGVLQAVVNDDGTAITGNLESLLLELLTVQKEILQTLRDMDIRGDRLEDRIVNG